MEAGEDTVRVKVWREKVFDIDAVRSSGTEWWVVMIEIAIRSC